MRLLVLAEGRLRIFPPQFAALMLVQALDRLGDGQLDVLVISSGLGAHLVVSHSALLVHRGQVDVCRAAKVRRTLRLKGRAASKPGLILQGALADPYMSISGHLKCRVDALVLVDLHRRKAFGRGARHLHDAVTTMALLVHPVLTAELAQLIYHLLLA